MCKKSAKADKAKIREKQAPHLLLFFVLLTEDMLQFYLYYIWFSSQSITNCIQIGKRQLDESTSHFLVTSSLFGTNLGSVTISLVTVTVAILSFFLPTYEQHKCLRKWNG
jgi:hypothetical protein